MTDRAAGPLLERLRIAAKVAPHARGNGRRRERPINVVDRHTGQVIRQASHEEVLGGILMLAEIELDVEPDPNLCCMCRKPATEWSATHARSKGTRPYCEEHDGRTAANLLRAKPRSFCSAEGCLNTSTQRSSAMARHRGSKSYCELHHGGPNAVKPILPCSVDGCSNLAMRESSRKARVRRGAKAYCKAHSGGLTAPKPRPICGVEGCSNLATPRSAAMARCRGTKPYCEAHKGGRTST